MKPATPRPASPPPEAGRRRLPLGPLRHRDFALVWSAALVSNIGSWMQTIAVGVLVTALTHQARWTGLVAAAGFLPVGVLAPVGGAMADRVDRRKWLLATTVGETAFATALAVLTATGHATPAGVTLLVLGGGCMTAAGFPAYQAMLPDLVGRDELLGAVSLSSAQFNLGRVVGPALAGVVIVAGSYTWAFVLNAASFGAVMVALLLLRLPPTPPRQQTTSLLADIRAGARAAAHEPGCRTAIAVISVAALLLSPFIALIPAVALKLFGKKAAGTSLLVTAQGAGAVVGALGLLPLARRVGRHRLLLADLAALPVLLVLYALSPSLPLAALALFGVGAAYIAMLSGLNTVVQLRAPPEARGRVLSLFMTALGTVYPVGAVLQGAAGDHLGLRTVSAGCALAFLAVVVIGRTARSGLADALDTGR